MALKFSSLPNHPLFLKYFKNTSWLLAEKVVRLFSSLVIGVWIARYLGPETFGDFSYIQSVVAICAPFATLGISGIVIRELVNEPDREIRILANAFALRFSGALLTYLVTASFLQTSQFDASLSRLILFAALTLFAHPFTVFDLYFQSRVQGRYSAIANMTTLAISITIKAALILLQAPMEALIWAIVFENALFGAFLLFLYLRKRGEGAFSLKAWLGEIRMERMKRLLGKSLPLLLSTFIIALYAQLDQIMLKHMLDSEAVGQYAAAFRLNAMWSVLPSVLIVSVTPALMRLDDALVDRKFSMLYRVLSLYGILSASLTLLLSSGVVELLYTEAYAGTSTIFDIMVFSNLFSFLGAASSRWFIRNGMERKILYRNLAGVGMNIGGNLLLIPAYGAEGAAITTLLSQVSANLLYDRIDRATGAMYRQKIDALLSSLRISSWKQSVAEFAEGDKK